MANLKISGVKKRFGETQTIHGVDLTIESGEFVVFVGPSGCGKSTLLRMIAGLETVTEGQVHIGQREVTRLAPSERKVAMVFQSYALYPHMTVADNLSFGMRMRGEPRAEISQKVERASNVLQLADYLARKPGELSGGQCQRVAIGRALVQDPDVFLFDEPLSNLDAELRVKMRTEIAELHGRLGATMIYVTHDQTEAMTLADRIVVLRDGRIEQVGAPMDLYRNPANQFVAGFIGSPKMNFLPLAVASQSAAQATVVVGEQQMSFDLQENGLENAAEAVLGIRPEHLFFSQNGPLKAQVKSTERLGAISFVYCTLADTVVCVQTAEPSLPAVGETVALDFIPSHAYLFNTQGRTVSLDKI
ncbi:ABC transporter ATP-binding protein [Simiduia sp. 21SJ11W-1]|uniref:ABC transporter ATP-binding protein n=1 Tax=Simiduia sp. 21SJ11W-1 TaxID=2909669 RepID=UPI00209FBD5A|nr:ABC transporter ATP-binding protein [Simiduia sp. 21SJ11W-1]UTA48303.1 ABC transporter ATP-binding protein [Simiduia sp. 21SJ11W-1]